MTRKKDKLRKQGLAHLFPKVALEVERLLPSHDAVWTADTNYSCYIRAHGYFYLTEVRDTNQYLFMIQALNRHLRPQVYSNGRIDGGDRLVRFLSRTSTSIVIQFGGTGKNNDLFLVTTTDQWQTIDIQTKPVSYLSTYLGTDITSCSSSPALKGLRDKGGKDVIYNCSDMKTVEGHSSILRLKWKAMQEIVDTTNHKPSDPEPLVITTEYPSDWIEALFAFLYGEQKPMGWRTAMGCMVMANVFELPELRSIAEAWLYAADDLSPFDAFHLWRQVHTFNDAVAIYSINLLKRDGHVFSRDALVLFVKVLTTDQALWFVRQFIPDVDYATMS